MPQILEAPSRLHSRVAGTIFLFETNFCLESSAELVLRMVFRLPIHDRPNLLEKTILFLTYQVIHVLSPP